LGQLGDALGKGVWRSLMVVLTHANAAREQLGPEYAQTMRQRRNILGNVMRQVSGEAQLKTPTFLADCHPDGPRCAFVLGFSLWCLVCCLRLASGLVFVAYQPPPP
jgi:heme exporter protein D